MGRCDSAAWLGYLLGSIKALCHFSLVMTHRKRRHQRAVEIFRSDGTCHAGTSRNLSDSQVRTFITLWRSRRPDGDEVPSAQDSPVWWCLLLPSDVWMKPCEAEFDYSHGVMMINSSLLRSNISSSVRLLRRLPLTHSLVSSSLFMSRYKSESNSIQVIEKHLTHEGSVACLASSSPNSITWIISSPRFAFFPLIVAGSRRSRGNFFLCALRNLERV